MVLSASVSRTDAAIPTIGRHKMKNKVHRWHIDCLQDYMDLASIWCSVEAKRVECAWPKTLYTLGGHCPVLGLGSSDCKCESHFFQFESEPNVNAFKLKIKESISIEN